MMQLQRLVRCRKGSDAPSASSFPAQGPHHHVQYKASSLQPNVAPAAKCRGRLLKCLSAQPSSETERGPSLAPVFKYPGEHSFNLSEYLVVLDKPIGLVLAPDPVTGQIVVQNIKEGSPAAMCGLIQVGDVVKMCSAVFGEDMWQAIDIRRIRWAINNRTSKVKLVLERSRRPAGVPTWYSKGQVGRASSDRDTLQLPVSFVSTSTDDWSAEMAAAGRPMYVAFHRSVMGTSAVAARSGPSHVARAARLQALREELSEARREPEMDLTSAYAKIPAVALGDAAVVIPYATATLHKGGPPPSSNYAVKNGSNASGNSNSGGGGGPLDRIMGSMGAGSSTASGSNTAQSSVVQRRAPRRPKEKKVIPVLPWLLVTSGRLDTRDLTHIASYRGLGALLELGLSVGSGALAVRGSEPNAASATPELPTPTPATGPPTGTDSRPGGNGSAAPGAAWGRAKAQEAGTSTAPPTPPAAPSSPAPEVRLRSLINAAASMHRLAVRRLHGSLHHASPDACTVLLHCEEGMDPEVACLLAGWLHWYNRMPLQEAILSAEIAMGCSIEQGVLEAATEALVTAAEERNNQVVLTWKYGGLSAFVAGDVVGSWANRIPLMRCKNPLGCKGATARGNFFLEITGLRPGLYYYKYIVDGTWAVDPTAPKVLDASGNWNNVVEVHERPPIVTSRERLAMARWQAMHMALETKMGLRPT